MAKEIIRSEDSDKIVILKYNPVEFPKVVTKSAESFVSAQMTVGSDFKISDLVAHQVGITELQKKSIEDRIELMALERLQKVEEKAYAEAYELGLIEGTQKAFDERRSEFEIQFQKINILLDSFQKIKAKIMVENESTFMRLIFEIASKIAMKAIQDDQQAVVDVLRKVVDDIQTEDQITVKISPEDMLFLESYKEKTGRQFELLDRLKLVASDHVASGGCLVETNSGSIDATVPQRITKAWDLIATRLPKYRDETSQALPAKESDDSDSDEE
jgi:flagellar assembly protein FliH